MFEKPQEEVQGSGVVALVTILFIINGLLFWLFFAGITFDEVKRWLGNLVM